MEDMHHRHDRGEKMNVNIIDALRSRGYDENGALDILNAISGLGLANGSNFTTVNGAVKDAGMVGVKATGDAAIGLERSVGAARHDAVKAVCDAEGRLSMGICDTRGAAVAATKDAEARLGTGISDARGAAVVATKDAEARLAKDVCDTRADAVMATKDAEARVTRDVLTNRADVLSAVKDCCCDIEKEIAEARAESAKYFRDVQLQACKDADEVKSVVYQQTKNLEKDIVVGFKDQLIVGGQWQAATQLAFKEQALLSRELACQASKELAECCCELKELIRADGQSTRDLINANEKDALRERNQELVAKLAALEARHKHAA